MCCYIYFLLIALFIYAARNESARAESRSKRSQLAAGAGGGRRGR
jgi:hypothetical protein